MIPFIAILAVMPAGGAAQDRPQPVAPPVASAQRVQTPHIKIIGNAAGVVLTPREAIAKAADAAPQGVVATYEMTVVATGRQRDMLYLNSRSDYRDQRCLTVAITPRGQTQLRDRLGDDLAAALTGKTIRVYGDAERVRIDITDDGEPTGKYYYQTHVRLANGRQLLSVR